ncbi:hypothetical protein ACE2PP_000468 [Salmonella enterica]|nr:hypothetical protein [Salmonella enterica subsp. enterica serovar Santiago]EJB9091927.1 hypothetical protein [Salmonella enterica]EBH8965771.1 hypothetical protein [Salmonella enterica subsp. enterica serovar Santiago]EJB9129219.1 hypothetical protein [Salmonella enterica]EJC0268965.1 hypothetical protein [Salmonella enterica]
MNKDQNGAAQALLREYWQGDALTCPRVAAFDPPRDCAGCGRPLAPDVLTVQPMATHCHYCRAGK